MIGICSPEIRTKNLERLSDGDIVSFQSLDPIKNNQYNLKLLFIDKSFLKFISLDQIKKINPTIERIVLGKYEVYEEAALRKSIQKGFFACFTNPLTYEKFDDIRTWARLPLLGKPSGKIYAFCGTKAVGKSEAAFHVSNFITGTSIIWKYSSRAKRYDDDIFGDTKQISEFKEDLNDHISWKSYDNQCVISRRDIDSQLEKGNDVLVAIGKREGLDKLMKFYPNSSYYIITRDPKEILKAVKDRGENHKYSLDSILKSQEELLIDNKNYELISKSLYNVCRNVEYAIAEERLIL